MPQTQPQHVGHARLAEMACAGRLQPDDIAERRDAQEQDFQEETLVRPDRQRLAKKA